METVLTPAQAKVVLRAYLRGFPYYVCPTPGLWGASQTAVLRALLEGGYIRESGYPSLTEKGILVARDLDRKRR